MTWLSRYVRGRLRNKELTEDIVQEIYIKAYRAYDAYEESGRLKGWLVRIADNAINGYFGSREAHCPACVSLESGDGDEASLIDLLPSLSPTPEEEVQSAASVSEILKVLDRLPVTQRTVFVHRIILDRDVAEVARMLQMAPGTVKSNTHHAVQRIRKELNIVPPAREDKKKGANIMTCREAYALLFMYAKGTISPEDKKNIEEHISGCKQCGDIAGALKELCPKLALGNDDETNHFIIGFSLNSGEYLSYLGFNCHFDNAKNLNEILEKTGGIIPDGENWLEYGNDSNFEHISEFDNEGNKIEVICYPSEAYPNNTRVRYIKMNKIFLPEHWSYSTQICKKSFAFTKSTEAPGLFYGHMQNSMGNNAHSALYLAIPGAAHNVRIKRGNGVHDCGAYKFAYVSRYVTEEERIVLDCSFLLD